MVKVRSYKKYWELFFLMFPFFSHVYSSSGIVYYFYVLGKSVAVVYLFIKYFYWYILKWRWNKISRMVFFSCMFLFFSTITNQGNIPRFMGYFYIYFGFAMMFEMNCHKYKKELLKALVTITRIMVYANFVLLLKYPNGVVNNGERYNFLGIDNAMMAFLIFGLSLFLFYNFDVIRKINILTVMDLLSCVIPGFIVWSATGMIGTIIVIVVYLLSTFWHRLFRFSRMTIAVLFFGISIVIFRILELWKEFIVDVLQKDITLSARTYIWDQAFLMILKKTVFGYGIQNTLSIIWTEYLGKYELALNEYLQCIINGGVIYFILVVWTVALCVNRLNRIRGIRGIAAGLIGLFVMYITESYGQMFVLYVLLYIGYYYSDYPFRYNKRKLFEMRR